MHEEALLVDSFRFAVDLFHRFRDLDLILMSHYEEGRLVNLAMDVHSRMIEYSYHICFFLFTVKVFNQSPINKLLEREVVSSP